MQNNRHIENNPWFGVIAVALAAGCAPPSHGDVLRAPDGGGQAGAGGAGGGAAGSGGTGGGGGAGKSCGDGTTIGGAGNPWRNPEIQCHWSPPDEQVFSTPLVADLDADGHPEIVFVAINCHQRICDPNAKPTRIVAIDGETCAEKWATVARVEWTQQIAIGDLDGDGRLEIVAQGYGMYFGDPEDNQVIVLDADGRILATSEVVPELAWMKVGQEGSGVALANLDGEGPPEIVIGRSAFRYEPGAPPRITKLWSGNAAPGFIGWLSAVADVDLDGFPDVVTGNAILDGRTGKSKTPPGLAGRAPGYPAIAQIDRDTPAPEIVLTSSTGHDSGLAAVDAKTGKLVFGPYPLPKSRTGGTYSGFVGGAPTVADFDGDGRPEIGLATAVDYEVWDPDCVGGGEGCASDGLLWKKPVQDETSGSTTSSVFDFNGDCAAEVVYRDECWLRIYDGRDGTVLAAYAISSGTLLEGPVIADSDGDGHAEIVVSSDDYPECHGGDEPDTGAKWTGPTSGVFVLRDPQDRWVPARRIWNQISYHVTNVNDDGSIPEKEKNSWDGANNYRQNVKP